MNLETRIISAFAGGVRNPADVPSPVPPGAWLCFAQPSRVWADSLPDWIDCTNLTLQSAKVELGAYLPRRQATFSYAFVSGQKGSFWVHAERSK